MSDEQGAPLTAADGRGILGKDFLGGADPVDVVREMRDASEPVTGPRYVPTPSEQEAIAMAAAMTNEETLATPVRFEIDDNEMATLTFGPMPLLNLEQMLMYLGTEDGSESFRKALAAQFADELSEQQGQG